MSNPPPVRPPITTHVLDTAKGQPAGHMTIKVFVYDSVRDDWSVISEGCVCGTTDTDALICVCMGGGGERKVIGPLPCLLLPLSLVMFLLELQMRMGGAHLC